MFLSRFCLHHCCTSCPRLVTSSILKLSSVSSYIGTRSVNTAASAEHEPSNGATGHVHSIATADEYNLLGFSFKLRDDDNYESKFLTEDREILWSVPKYKVADADNREFFTFRDGAVVCWNIQPSERNQFLACLRPFHLGHLPWRAVRDEIEALSYVDSSNATVSMKNGILLMSLNVRKTDNVALLERSAISFAVYASVKLAVWERIYEDMMTQLEKYTDLLQSARLEHIDKVELLRLTGKIHSLRQNVNTAPFYDVPDFFWSVDDVIENTYLHVAHNFNLQRRIKILTERLEYSLSLLELINNRQATEHGARLEKIIIFLIAVEIGFEIVHYVERWYLAGVSNSHGGDL